jgi:hypothetical protein
MDRGKIAVKHVTLCHCFAEAVPSERSRPGTACSKQWHTLVKKPPSDHVDAVFLRRFSQLGQRPGLDLPDALFRHAHFRADLL